MVQFGEFWLDHIRKVLPFYSEAKLALLVWLGAFSMCAHPMFHPQPSPPTGGAHLIYESGVRPFLKQHEGQIDKHMKQAEDQAAAAMKKK